jgi:hypothetical protein
MNIITRAKIMGSWALREFHEAEEGLRTKLLTDKDAALPSNPGEEPFDRPAPRTSAKPGPISRSALATIGLLRRD